MCHVWRVKSIKCYSSKVQNNYFWIILTLLLATKQKPIQKSQENYLKIHFFRRLRVNLFALIVQVVWQATCTSSVLHVISFCLKIAHITISFMVSIRLCSCCALHDFLCESEKKHPTEPKNLIFELYDFHLHKTKKHTSTHLIACLCILWIDTLWQSVG